MGEKETGSLWAEGRKISAPGFLCIPLVYTHNSFLIEARQLILTIKHHHFHHIITFKVLIITSYIAKEQPLERLYFTVGHTFLFFFTGLFTFLWSPLGMRGMEMKMSVFPSAMYRHHSTPTQMWLGLWDGKQHALKLNYGITVMTNEVMKLITLHTQ